MNDDGLVPRRPRPTQVSTTGGISRNVRGGYETPTGEDVTNHGPRGPSTPVVRHAHSDSAVPLRRADSRSPPPPPHASLNDLVLRAKRMRGGRVGIRDRIACFRWTWFTMTMATGGIANALAAVPFRARWLDIVGLVFFCLNLALFTMNCILITLRFRYRPGSFVNTFTDQVESLFIPAVVVSIATILITVCEYGIPHTGPWLLQTMQVLFWTYIAISTLASAGIYLILWSTLTFPIHTMTPTWVFPAYPLLLTAPFGGVLLSTAVETDRLHHLNGPAIMFASVTVQGAGFLIAFMICSAFIYRLMTQKLPRDAQRPGVFISIGPFGFTVGGLVTLGNLAGAVLPAGLPGSPQAVPVLQVLSTAVGIWLWGLCVWFFLVSVGSLWKYLTPGHRLPFQVTWFSFVFPNTALVTATLQLARALGDNRPLAVLGCVVAAALVLVWLLVFASMLWCLWRRELLWPEDEDD